MEVHCESDKFLNDECDDYVINSIATIKLLLRRSVQGSLRYSAIASQFTQSEAKGRTLQRSVLYSSFIMFHPLPGGAGENFKLRKAP